MLEQVTFYFVCSFAIYGAVCLAGTLWDRYQRRQRSIELHSEAIRAYDDAFKRVYDATKLYLDKDDHPKFDDIVDELVDSPGDSADAPVGKTPRYSYNYERPDNYVGEWCGICRCALQYCKCSE